MRRRREATDFFSAFASNATSVPVGATADTIFAIGSSTKAMTATTLAMLVDEGKLSWDDPIAKHLPELVLQIDAKKGEKATVRDLLL